MRNENVIKINTSFRPSSPRRNVVRGIGAALTLYPAQKHCGMTECAYRHGFTLIELLVVVLIIGILAAVALPQYQKAVDKASFTCAMTILKSLTDAQTVAALEKGGYPPSGNYFTFNDLNITIPVENQNCLETDLCSIKCNGKDYRIILRNSETWANFYFWANSLERLVYRKENALPWQLQCVSARCNKLAKAFGATDCTGGLCW